MRQLFVLILQGIELVAKKTALFANIHLPRPTWCKKTTNVRMYFVNYVRKLFFANGPGHLLLGTLRERNHLLIMMTATMMTRFPQLGLQKFHGGDEARERQSKGPGRQQCQFYREPRPRREILATTGVYSIFVQSGNYAISIAYSPLLFLMFSTFLQSEVQEC